MRRSRSSSRRASTRPAWIASLRARASPSARSTTISRARKRFSPRSCIELWDASQTSDAPAYDADARCARNCSHLLTRKMRLHRRRGFSVARARGDRGGHSFAGTCAGHGRAHRRAGGGRDGVDPRGRGRWPCRESTTRSFAAQQLHGIVKAFRVLAAGIDGPAAALEERAEESGGSGRRHVSRAVREVM